MDIADRLAISFTAVSLRRKLSYIAASVIAGAGMMTGHWMATAARQAGGESAIANSLGILSWVIAGAVAVLIDRSVPPRAVALASLALPLVWFGGLLVSEDRTMWLLGFVLLLVFALLAGVSAAAVKWLFKLSRRSRARRYSRG